MYDHHKERLFEDWGYSIADSALLRSEIERQGLDKYTAGDYALGKRNDQGQRISIRVELLRKDTGDPVSFLTGWMVYPNGHIQLTTPYGGK